MRIKLSTINLLGIILSIISVSCNNKENNNAYHKYIVSPQKGDIYEIKLEKKENETDFFYSIYKVNDFTNDSIFVYTTEYNLNQKEKLDLLNKDGLFSKKLKAFSKPEVQQLLENNTILKIKRN